MRLVYAEFWGKKRRKWGELGEGEKVISGKFSVLRFKRRVKREADSVVGYAESSRAKPSCPLRPKKRGQAACDLPPIYWD